MMGIDSEHRYQSGHRSVIQATKLMIEELVFGMSIELSPFLFPS